MKLVSFYVQTICTFFKSKYQLIIRDETKSKLFILVNISFILVILLSLHFRFRLPIPQYLFFWGMFLLATSFFYKKRFILGGVFLAFGVLWVIFFASLYGWVSMLGVDSMAESQGFNWSEAAFYLTTLKHDLTSSSLRKAAIFLVCGGIIYFVLHMLQPWLKKSKKVVFSLRSAGVVIILISLVLTFHSIFALHLRNKSTASQIVENFSFSPPPSTLNRKDMVVVVYIGESTSVMNMGLYGYPRNTTPYLSKRLEADKGFLRFKNVFSTHTHTVPSLLEALSLSVASSNDNFLPIVERKRSPVVNFLDQNGIKTFLISNQRQTEFGNFLPATIFGRSKKTFSSEALYHHAYQRDDRKPADDEFFELNMKETITAIPEEKGGVVFLHSYAGHGLYLNNIPKHFSEPVDDYLSTKNPEGIVGNDVTLLNDVDEYDSAIRYIDYSVNKTIEQVSALERPAVVIYFSDHGDSVFTNRAHDSSRFVHEMARVPFVMHFNESSRKEYPDLFEKYKAFSEASNTATLAQLPSTILDLFDTKFSGNSREMFPVVGKATTTLPPILLRETATGLSYVNLNSLQKPNNLVKNIRDVTDEATQIFALSNSLGESQPKVCYHRSNTLAKAMRGAMITNCLEIDLVVEDNGALEVNHPPIPSVGFELSTVFEIIKSNQLTLWIDSKNTDNPKNCNVLLDAIKAADLPDGSVFIEFPSAISFDDQELVGCAKELQKSNARTSFYVKMDEAKACSDSLDQGMFVDASSACLIYEETLNNAYNSGMFTDFSFGYNVVHAMEKLPVAQKLRWNTWDVTSDQFYQIKPERFGLIIFRNKDPNNR